MSCYTEFFNVRRGWQSLNTGPRFYLRLIRRTGWLWISTSRTTDGRPFKPKKLSVPFLYPGVPVGLTPFRGPVPLGRRNLVPILPPAHPLWGGLLGQMEPNLAGSIYVRSKPGIDGPWVCPFQNCVRQPHPPFKMAAVFLRYWLSPFEICFSIILLSGERYRLSGLSL